MQRNSTQINEELAIKELKTVSVFIMSTFIGALTGSATATVIIDLAVAYALHELGKSRRPGSNAMNSMYSLFSSHTGMPGNDVNNWCRNIINGGAAVVDEVQAKLIEQDVPRQYRR